MPNLKETQKLVWKLITAPEGVQKALEGTKVELLPIKGDERLSAADRLDIYANMYFYRIRDSLKVDFPALLKLIGEDRFHNLVTDYLMEHPSRHWTLRNVGESLSKFLTTHSLVQEFPYIAELARFEWELIEVFDAPDSLLFTAENLQSIDPEKWGELQFSLIPSASLVEFKFPVDSIFQTLTVEVKGDLKISNTAGKTSVLFWRKDLQVRYRKIEPLEACLLKAVKQGEPFAQLCERAAEEVGEKDAIPAVSSSLQTWLENGLLEAPTGQT